MSRYKRHFFVCVNQRPPEDFKPSCAKRNSFELMSALKSALERNPALWETVKVTASACMGPCEFGPVMVVYPEGFWYANVTAEDIPEIVDSHLLGGKPVERLEFKW